jgi:hypothetical protein
MEHMRLRVWCLGLAAVALLAANVAVAQPQLPYENHYKVYRTPLIPFTKPILLRDQFGQYQVQVFNLEAWSNPTEKIIPETGDHYPIINPIVHQMWWRGNFPGIPPIEIIGIDQFGTNKWTLINPEYLLTPALKNVPQGEPPVWNHYLCYASQPVPITKFVVLVDQFGTTTHQLVYGRWFCNPVEKTHLDDGRVYPIVDAKAHLACYYTFNTSPMAFPVSSIDQFGQWHFDVFNEFCLCTPALKEHVVKTEESTWGKIKAMYQ